MIIQLLTLYGVLTTFNCNDIFYTNEYPKGSQQVSDTINKQVNCKVSVVKNGVSGEAFFYGPCSKVHESCELKVKK